MTASALAALIWSVVDSIKTDVPKPADPGSEQALSTGAASMLEAAKNALEGTHSLAHVPQLDGAVGDCLRRGGITLSRMIFA